MGMVRDYGFAAERQDQLWALWALWRRCDSPRSIAKNLGRNNQRVRNFLLQAPVSRSAYAQYRACADGRFPRSGST